MLDFHKESFEVKNRDGLTLRGELRLPEVEGPYPLAVICPGFMESMSRYGLLADYLAQVEVAAATFDYTGGCPEGCASDGDAMRASVLTQSNDLSDLVSHLRGDERFSSFHLIGFSQGGLVAAIAARRHSDRILSLNLFSPAYVIPDHARERFKDKGEIPEAVDLLGTRVGRAYYEDVIGMDVWSEVAGYDGEVLILCGSEDDLVPNEYAFKANDLYANSECILLNGAGHSFNFRESFPFWGKIAKRALRLSQ